MEAENSKMQVENFIMKTVLFRRGLLKQGEYALAATMIFIITELIVRAIRGALVCKNILQNSKADQNVITETEGAIMNRVIKFRAWDKANENNEIGNVCCQYWQGL